MWIKRFQFSFIEQREYASKKKTESWKTPEEIQREKFYEKAAKDPAKVAEQQAKLAESKGLTSGLTKMQELQIKKMGEKGYTHKFENGQLSFFDKNGNSTEYTNVFKSSKEVKPKVSSAPKEVTPQQVETAINTSTPANPEGKPKRGGKKTKKSTPTTEASINGGISGSNVSSTPVPGNGSVTTTPQPSTGTITTTGKKNNPKVNYGSNSTSYKSNKKGGWSSSNSVKPNEYIPSETAVETAVKDTSKRSMTNTASNVANNTAKKSKGFFGKMGKNTKIGLGITGGAALTGGGLYAYNKYKNKK